MLNNVPLPGNTLLGTRDQIAANFSNINTGFSANHNELTLAGAGKHKYLQMPQQLAVPVTVATEAGLCAKIGAKSGKSELVFTRDGVATEIPFTECKQNPIGWTMLPSGLVMKWGTGTIAGGVLSHPCTFLVGADMRAFTAAPYSIQLTLSSNTVSGANGWDYVIYVSAFNSLGFTVARVNAGYAAGAIEYNYLAIGV